MTRRTIRYNQDNEVKVHYNWWSQTIAPEQRYEHIWGVVRGILQKQEWRSYNNLRFARLYHNFELLGLDPGMYARTAQRDSYLTNRVTLNVIKSCVDTAASKISKSKPRPYFLTEDGNWSIQTKAKRLTNYMDGWFYGTHGYSKAQKAFIDGSVFGTGGVKIFKEAGEVKCERVIIEEIIVDEAEGMYGTPQQMHQKKAVFRDVLAQVFPEHKAKIEAATSSLRKDYTNDYYADLITVLESWHLPSGKDKDGNFTGDGRHTISIDNCTLLDEPYNKDYFPFAFFRWTEPLLGFFGTGLAEELIGIQLELNKLLRNIQLAQHLMAVPQVWLEANSKIPASHINNEIGGIKRYVGAPPQFQVPPAMSPEIYQYVETLYQRAYQITGISAMSARAEKPSGITAAVALETLSDMETERFMVTAQRYEQFHLDITKIVIDQTRELAEAKELKPMKAPGQDYLETINWKDIDLDDDKFVLKCYPTNLLPTQPAGKLQRIQEMMQAGMFDREDAISLLDYPDLKSVSSRLTAPRDDVLKIIHLMLDKGEYISPEPFMNLDLAKKLTQSEYLKAKTQGADDERLELLRRFMDDCDNILEQVEMEKQKRMMEAQMAEQQAAMPPEAMAPTAVPEAMPANELMALGGQV